MAGIDRRRARWYCQCNVRFRIIFDYRDGVVMLGIFFVVIVVGGIVGGILAVILMIHSYNGPFDNK